jgi:hypothetical protein
MPDVAQPDLPKAEPKPLHQLGRYGHECRWPVLEDREIPGNFLFCGQPTRRGKRFCDEHMTLARDHRKVRP